MSATAKYNFKFSFVVLLSLVISIIASFFSISYVNRETGLFILNSEARHRSENWADIIGKRYGGQLQSFFNGEALDKATFDFFSQVGTLDDVFFFKIFDETGKLRLTADVKKQTVTFTADDEHAETAREVMRSGRPDITIKNGDSIRRPKVFSEAYVPIAHRGARLGVMEIYVDHKDRFDQILGSLQKIALVISLMSVAVMVLPLLAYRQQNKLRLAAFRELDHMASHDGLTGLLNRASFGKALQEMELSGVPYAVHLIDLDKFKAANDSYGHAAGDGVLVEVAQRIRALLDADTIAARLGGDEFVLLQKIGNGSAATARALANRVVDAMSAPIILGTTAISIGCSVGSACSWHNNLCERDLTRQADAALYAAKRGGRNRAILYHHDLDAAAARRVDLVRRVREACLNDGFELVYQPVFETGTGRLRAFEAMPELKGVGSDQLVREDLLRIAEDEGLSPQIFTWTLQYACQHASQWPQEITITIPVPFSLLASGDFAETVSKALHHAGLDSSRLELQLAEASLVKAAPEALGQLRRLRLMGVKLAVADFGETLRYLWDLPIDGLKINHDLLQSAAPGKAGATGGVVEALAGSLGVMVTVDGVTTDEQMQRLAEQERWRAQGDFLAPPVAPERLAAVMSRNAGKRLRAAATGGQAATAPRQVMGGTRKS